ncbi:MAG: elongation factor G [bacterium]|nr:elongation factor G [bacterium]
MLKEYKTEQIRNVAIIGHDGTGKSTLFDAMLFVGGQIDKVGSVSNGTLTSDYDAEEKEKQMSIRSALGFVELDGVKINIIDTPGKSDFVGEARAALQVAECAILVVDAVDGVQIETEKAWRFLKDNNIPRIIFVNSMDKERANYDNVIVNLKSSLKVNTASLCIPQGQGDQFTGVVDIIDMKLMTPKGTGKDVTVTDIPDDMKDLAELERSNLIELAAEGDDELIEKYLEGEELTEDEIRRGISEQLALAKLSSVICGSVEKVIGIKNLLRVIKDYAPSPVIGKEYQGKEPGKNGKELTVESKPDGPMATVAWKTYIDQYAGRFNYFKVISGEFLPDVEVLNGTKNIKERVSKLYSMVGDKQVDIPKLNCGDIGVTIKLDKTATLDTLCDAKHPVDLPFIEVPHPVFSYAVEAVNKSEVDKIGQFFHRVTEENPTITYAFNSETHETVFSGMGEMQLGIILHSLKEKNKLDVATREPRVAYRETITRKAEAQYKHKKQSGGHGQYGEVYIRLEPRTRGEGYEFKDSIVGGVVPKQYIPGVQKGMLEGMDEGVLAKCPIVDLSVELYDGSFHAVDSSEMSFKIAARQALRKGMQAAGPQLLEPVMQVSIFVDKQFMGDILSDVTSRRGKVLGMDSAEDSGSNVSVVKASIPLAEMLRYTIDLRAMTSGKATFEMVFSHYDPISGREAEKVIEDRKKQLEEEANK